MVPGDRVLTPHGPGTVLRVEPGTLVVEMEFTWCVAFPAGAVRVRPEPASGRARRTALRTP